MFQDRADRNYLPSRLFQIYTRQRHCLRLIGMLTVLVLSKIAVIFEAQDMSSTSPDNAAFGAGLADCLMERRIDRCFETSSNPLQLASLKPSTVLLKHEAWRLRRSSDDKHFVHSTGFHVGPLPGRGLWAEGLASAAVPSQRTSRHTMHMRWFSQALARWSRDCRSHECWNSHENEGCVQCGI